MKCCVVNPTSPRNWKSSGENVRAFCWQGHTNLLTWQATRAGGTEISYLAARQLRSSLPPYSFLLLFAPTPPGQTIARCLRGSGVSQSDAPCRMQLWKLPITKAEAFLYWLTHSMNWWKFYSSPKSCYFYDMMASVHVCVLTVCEKVTFKKRPIHL